MGAPISTWPFEAPPRFGWRYRLSSGGTLEAMKVNQGAAAFDGDPAVIVTGRVFAVYRSRDGEHTRSDWYLLETRECPRYEEPVEVKPTKRITFGDTGKPTPTAPCLHDCRKCGKHTAACEIIDDIHDDRHYSCSECGYDWITEGPDA